jgi:CheY-like chemotaxis protein
MDTQGKPRALVVDDRPTNRTAMSWILTKAGFSCDVATSGVHALVALDRQTYDLVLTDCNLGHPEFTGAETARKLRLKAPTTRIVAVTDDSADGLDEELARLSVELISRANIRLYFLDMVPGYSIEDQVRRAVEDSINHLLLPIMRRADMMGPDGKPDFDALGDALSKAARRRRSTAELIEAVRSRAKTVLAAGIVALTVMAIQWAVNHAWFDGIAAIKKTGGPSP